MNLKKYEGDPRTKGYVKNKPCISIITVVFNDEKFLEATIQSVINQTYKNVEYIIIDGGSTDGTVDIIKKYESKIDYWISEKDTGIYDAMNKGIELAHGDWINFMNAGDKFYNNTTLKCVFANSYDVNVAVIYGATKIVATSGLSKIVFPQVKSQKYHHNFFHQSSFVLASVQKKYKFDSILKIAADADFFASLYSKNYQFVEVKEIISIFMLDGISNTLFWRALKEECIVGQKYNRLFFFLFLPTMILRVSKHILKKILPAFVLNTMFKFKKYS